MSKGNVFMALLRSIGDGEDGDDEYLGKYILWLPFCIL